MFTFLVGLHADIPCFIGPLFYGSSPMLHFLQIEGFWQPCIEQACQSHFSNSICLHRVSVLYFGNSPRFKLFHYYMLW